MVPLFNRMKILPDEVELKTKSGLVLPTSAKASERKLTGTIVGVGNQVEYLKEGERILFGEYAGFKRYEDEEGNEVSEHKGTRYMYMNESDAIAIVGGWK